MRITINGEESMLAEGSTVTALLDALKLDTGNIAVELNLAIVPRSRYGETPVRDGDAVEIVRFIGGG